MVYFPTDEMFYPEDYVENVFLTTRDGIKIHCYFIDCGIPDTPVLLTFHGNAENANMGIEIAGVYRKMGISVILTDYRGYGKCEGYPTEEGTYIDAETYYDFAVEKARNINKIVIHGRSLGGAVAINLARNHKSAGLILESTFTTATEVFGIPEEALGAKYRSIDKIKEISTPVLFIHGTADTLVPYWMTESLFELLPAEKEIYKIKGAGHNDVLMFAGMDYFKKIYDFIKKVTQK